MRKCFCDFCGQEVEKQEVKVTMNELEYDACTKCANRLARIAHYQKWGDPTEPDENDRKEAKEDFWATHDPSGGDLPPEDDENDEKSVGGGYEVDP